MSNSLEDIDFLETSLEVDPTQIFNLAQILQKKMRFLEIADLRQRIREDPYLPTQGAKGSFHTANVIQNNLNLIAFLCKSALRLGHLEPKVYNLLAEALYKLERHDAVLEVVKYAKGSGKNGSALEEVHILSTLETCDIDQIRSDIRGGGADAGSDLRRMKIYDYGEFSEWIRSIGSETFVVTERKSKANTTYRHVHHADRIEIYENEIEATPLLGARVDRLQVLIGSISFVGENGFYDEHLLPTRARENVVKISKRHILYSDKDAVHTEFKGKYLVPSAANNYFSNYFHVICQICVRLIFSLESGEFSDHKILMPDNTPSWVIDFMEIAGIDRMRFEFMPTVGISTVEHAVVLPMKWDVCPAEIEATRQAIFKNIPREHPQKDYYLVRRDVKNFTRALVNEEEFIKICEKRGFSIVDPLDYSLEEQIRMFSNARTIVSSGSSAITNMLYANAGAEIVVIGPRLFWGMLFPDLATACGHNFSVVFGEFIAGNENTSHPHNPYVAEPKALEVLLDQHLDRVR
ncbi:glycosyltransferase family 61 protein [Roseibium polysiphoniae]|uniref:Glycosyltransferase family 61 protein n=1 Tax=Roseibium polysiphoniae TaxID=2571221 RepID=A0ABR9C9V3_9HYPH|nr:glycosyltransferase 61 family protein [Roseibium polysiphoniae]MBD8876660.1 glycosyltransferase family 61 protein [Roseibium polysiphoniae]